jgi:CheY-like chemotaxis protein
VLYVEDNAANLLLVEQLLARRPDLQLHAARDGHAGLAMARALLPDVILMDIHLPGLTGLQVLELLQQDSATAHIPVLALSASAMPRDIQTARDAGVFNYLTKPIRIHAFMAALDDALAFSQTTADSRFGSAPPEVF